MAKAKEQQLEFGNYSVEVAEAEHNDSKRTSFMKLKQGRNIVRVLPPMKGQSSPFQVVFQHYVDLPGQESPVQFVCPRMMAKKECPICSQMEKYRTSSEATERNKVARLAPKRRIYANVLDRSDPNPRPLVVSFGRMVYDQLNALRRDATAGGDFTHPLTGFDVVIERTGSGKNDTRYAVRPARNSSPVWGEKDSPDIETIQNLINGQENLASLVEILTPDQIMAKLEESAGVEQQRSLKSGSEDSVEEEDFIDTEDVGSEL